MRIAGKKLASTFLRLVAPEPGPVERPLSPSPPRLIAACSPRLHADPPSISTIPPPPPQPTQPERSYYLGLGKQKSENGENVLNGQAREERSVAKVHHWQAVFRRTADGQRPVGQSVAHFHLRCFRQRVCVGMSGCVRARAATKASLV